MSKICCVVYVIECCDCLSMFNALGVGRLDRLIVLIISFGIFHMPISKVEIWMFILQRDAFWL